MYHHISTDTEGEGYVTPRRFKNDLELLKQNGFHFISVEQLAAFTEGKAGVPANAVVITFDDGYEDVYRYAFPIMKKRRVPSAVFIIGSKMDKEGYLNWDQVRSMEKSGLVTIGGHTFDQHYRVPIASGKKMPATVAHIYDTPNGHWETRDEYLKRITEDCRRLKEVFVAELGHDTEYFAYPYGAYSQDYVQVLQKSGYKYIFTVARGTNTQKQNPALFHRINAGTPRMPPEKLIAHLKSKGVTSVIPVSQPPAWSPIWDV